MTDRIPDAYGSRRVIRVENGKVRLNQKSLVECNFRAHDLLNGQHNHWDRRRTTNTRMTIIVLVNEYHVSDASKM